MCELIGTFCAESTVSFIQELPPPFMLKLSTQNERDWHPELTLTLVFILHSSTQALSSISGCLLQGCPAAAGGLP